MEGYKLYITYVALLSLGILLGMVIQQGIIQSTLIKVASNMDGVEIDINFNESKIVEGIKNNFIPDLKEVLNNSMNKDFNGCKPIPCECWEWGCALYCMECDDAFEVKDD